MKTKSNTRPAGVILRGGKKASVSPPAHRQRHTRYTHTHAQTHSSSRQERRILVYSIVRQQQQQQSQAAGPKKRAKSGVAVWHQRCNKALEKV